MHFTDIIIFVAKVFFIDVIIELLRQAAYAIQHNAWAGSLLHTAKNRYFDWFLQGFEICGVIILLVLGYRIPFIVIVMFLITYILKHLGNWILSEQFHV